MQSTNILFTQPGQVDLISQAIEPITDDTVLCKAVKSLISTGTETTCLRGVFDAGTNWFDWVKYPFHPGYSMTAQITRTGKNVPGLKEGDFVFAARPHQQYFTCLPQDLYPIPAGIHPDEAAWFSLLRIAQNGARRAQIQMGDAVVVIGLGVVGMLTVQYACICGATKVIAIDTVEDRVALAAQLGATHTLTLRSDQAKEALSQITRERLADVVFDTTGNHQVLASACQLARKYGKVVLLGDSPQPSKQAIGPGVVSNYLSILGAHELMVAGAENEFYPWTRRKVQDIACELLLQKRIDVKSMITDYVSPAHAKMVYQDLLEGNSTSLGIIFDWDLLTV